jgi:predicted negative regulator of RcsB-dependent stress response
VPRPAPLLDLLAQAEAAGGKDSATKVYRGLRERFYGRAAYDFGEVTLNTFAGRLARDGRFDDALSMVQLNAEFFPVSSNVPFVRGEVLLARRDTTAAISEYRRSIAIDGNMQAKQRLTSLNASMP